MVKHVKVWANIGDCRILTIVMGNVVHSGLKIAFSLIHCIIYSVEDSGIAKPANAVPWKPPYEMMAADMLHPFIDII
jgi:hypothetical protein